MNLNRDIEHWLVNQQNDFHDAAVGKGRERCHVTLSYAQSWDGSITAAPGETLALSSDAGMQMTHQLRSLHNGILVGIGTVLADDPRLTVRKWTGRDPQPIVLDSQSRIPASSQLCQSGEQCCWVLTTQKEATDRNDCELIVVPEDEAGQVNLHPALELLYLRGIRNLMVEGGASVITSFLRAGLADVLVLTVAPIFVGGYNAIGRLGDPDKLSFPQIASLHSRQLGNELIVWGKLCYNDEPDSGPE